MSRKIKIERAPLTQALQMAAAAEEQRSKKEARPEIRSAAGKGRPSSHIQNGASMNSKRVLVVDDEQCIANTLVAILQKSGYDAMAAYSAESAMEHCKLAAPGLIISDVVMPGTGGVELAIYVRKNYPDCRILLFSGQAATTDILKRARNQGHQFDLLAKPVHPKHLLARIAQ